MTTWCGPWSVCVIYAGKTHKSFAHSCGHQPFSLFSGEGTTLPLDDQSSTCVVSSHPHLLDLSLFSLQRACCLCLRIRQTLSCLCKCRVPKCINLGLVTSDRNSFKGILNIIRREGNDTPLQYSCLENPRDGGAWWAAVHGVAKSQTRLRGFTFTFHFHALEKEMATHSSVLA